MIRSSLSRPPARSKLFGELHDYLPPPGFRSERQRPRKRRLDDADQRLRRQPTALSRFVR